jgi:DNA uptake protein ComE-like DNA-binding protein
MRIKKYLKCFVIPIALGVLILTCAFYNPKPDIRRVDKYTIAKQIDGIGLELAERVKDYCISNNIESVQDLKEGQINRIGEKTLEKLKENYK